MGTVQVLFPPGVTHIMELPAPFFDAIRTSMMFLGFEEMPEGDAPPRRIWLDDERLTEWFENLKAKRKAEMEPNSPQRSSSEPMKRNGAAKDLVVG